MKKIITYTLVVFLFSFIYLHQKVLIYIEAYKINHNYNECNKLVDMRDNLLYNFSKKVSIDKVNRWAKVNNFYLPTEGKKLVLNIEEKKREPRRNIIAYFLNQLFKISSPGPKALADTE